MIFSPTCPSSSHGCTNMTNYGWTRELGSMALDSGLGTTTPPQGLETLDSGCGAGRSHQCAVSSQARGRAAWPPQGMTVLPQMPTVTPLPLAHGARVGVCCSEDYKCTPSTRQEKREKKGRIWSFAFMGIILIILIIPTFGEGWPNGNHH